MEIEIKFDESMKQIPKAESVPDGECVSIITVAKGKRCLELVIEPYELENDDDDYKHSSYVLYEDENGETIERNNMFDDLSEMSIGEVINSLIAML